MNEEYDVDGGDKFTGVQKDLVTIQSIVMGQLQRITTEMSKEMLPGGTRVKLVKGHPVEVFCDNQMQVDCNSIEMLKILLLPDLQNASDEIKELIQTHEQQLQSLKQEYNDDKKKIEEYAINKRKRVNSDPKKVMNWRNDKMEDLNTQYQNNCVLSYRDNLLPALVLLLAKANYYEEYGVDKGDKPGSN